MMRNSIINGLICLCLLLVLSGCGNKGPLELPEEEEKKTQGNTG
ncbi:MAG: lipoprotein [Gammaproteobacteria bacterium]|nr:lipoprotein [Gammaproteobacteria bacterium]